jgi:hypothetical protein
MSKKVAKIIVETLQSAGVRHCYGVAGDTLNLIARSNEPRSRSIFSPYSLNVGLAKHTRETSRNTHVQFAPARKAPRWVAGTARLKRNALSHFD